MADNLRILLSASLNLGKSIGDINSAISGLEKKINSLKLRIEVPQDFQKSIQSFITATEKMKKISDEQNKVIRESQDVYKKLDGTITTVTQKVLANGEVIQKTKTIHDANKKAMQDESIAAQKLTDAVDKQNKASLDSITILKNKANATSGFQVKSSQGYTVTTKRLESDGETLVGSSIVTNYKKQREEQQKTLDDNLKATRANLLQEEREHQAFINNTKKQYDSLQSSIRKNLLQEENDTRNFVEKAKKQYESLTAKQEELLLKIADYQRRFAGDKKLVSNLGNLAVDAKSINLVQDGEKGLQRLNTQMKEYVNQANSARSNSISFGEAMQTALTRIVQWGVSTTLIYGSLRQFKEGIAYINQLDNALNQIRIVTGKSQEDVKKLAVEYNNLGKQMSVSTKDIALTGASLFRQGLNEDQVKDRMDAVIKYAKISDLSLQESDKIITASVNGTKASTSELIDIFSYLGDTTSAGADEIGRAFQKTASLAAVAGLDYKKLASYIATVSSVTRESAETIGNSFKSLLSRYQSIKEKGFNAEDATNINQVTRALKDVGDQTGTTLDAIDKSTGQLRNYGDVLDDLAKVWDKLNPKQKEYLQTTLGGTYQADKFAALMNNYKASIKSYTGSLDAAGIANQKFQIWQDSSAAKIERFKASWEGFWEKSIDSSTIKTFISLGTSLVSSLDNIGNVVLLVSGLFLTFKSQAVAGLITGAASSVQALFATKTALQSTAQAAEASTVAVNGTAIAMTGLQRALGIIGLVLTAGSLLYSVFNQVDDATQSLNKTIDENNKKYNDNASAIGNTLTYYKQNYDAINSNTEVKNQLFEMQNKLIDTFGKEASGIDLVNGKYSEQIAKIKDLNKANLDNKIKDNQINVNTISEKKYSNPTIGYTPTLKHEIGFESNKSYDVGGDIGLGNLKFEDYYKKLLDLQDQIRNKNTAIFDGQALIPQSAQEWSNVLTTVQTKITELKPLYDQIISLENDKKEKIKGSALEQGNFNGEQIKFFESLDGILKKQPTKEYESSIKNVVATVKGFDGKNMADLIEKIKQLPEIKSNNNLMKGLDDLSNSLKGSSDQTVDFGSKIKDLDSNIENTDKSISSLASAYQKLNEGEQLSTSEILKLAKEHPQLLSYLSSHNGLIEDKGQILQQVAEIERKTQLAEAEGLRNSVTNTFNSLESKRKMYAEFYSKIAPIVNPLLNNSSFNSKDYGQGGLSDTEKQQLADAKKQKEELDLTVSLLSQPIDLKTYGKKPDKPNSEPTPYDDSQKYQIDEYKQALRDLDGQTKESESIMTRYKDTSVEYRDELEKQVKLTKEKQKLTSDEGIRLRGDISTLESQIASAGDQKKKNALLQQLDQAKNNLADLSKSWWDYELSVELSDKKLKESLFNSSKDWINNEKSSMELGLKSKLEIAQMEYDGWVRIEAKKSQYTQDQQDEINKNLVTSKHNLENAISDDSIKKASDALDPYTQKIKNLNNLINSIHSTNSDKINAESDLLDTYADERKQIDANISSLENLSKTLSINSDAYIKNQDEIKKQKELREQNIANIDAENQKLKNQIIEQLKSGYESEKKLQDQQLQNNYDAQVNAINEKTKALENQKSAIDDLIKSLQDQWKAEDDNLKLAELQSDVDKTKADKRFETVNADGSTSLTYDVQKVTDLEKQLAEERKRISRDTQIKQLEDQKTGLDKQIQGYRDQEAALQTTYNNQKEALDNYWTYKLSQTQLQQEADNLIAKEGYKNALIDAQQFVIDMGAKWDTLVAKAAAAGAAIAASLGGLQSPSNVNNYGNYNGVSSYTPTKQAGTLIPKYHTGGTVGQIPLQDGEVPAILKIGEDVFTKIQKLKLEDIIVKPLDYLSGLFGNIKNTLPNFASSSSSSIANEQHYHFNDLTIKSNDVNGFLDQINFLVTSTRK